MRGKKRKQRTLKTESWIEPEVAASTRVHSVWDEAMLGLLALGDAKSSYDQTQLDSVRAMRDTARLLSESQVTSFEKQMGKTLAATTFETKVLKLCPQVVFRTHNNSDPETAFTNPHVRVIFLTRSDGEARYIASYIHRPLLPELTTILTKPVKVPVQVLRDSEGNLRVNAKDFPKAEKTGEETYWDPTAQADGSARGYVTAPVYEFVSDTPLDETVEEPVDALPGWRSILLMLIWSGLTTPVAVEKEFGAADNKVWAHKTGQRDFVDVAV